MKINIITLILKYFKELDLSIDQKEFQLQYELHPDYPSLLALSDTLTFFKIDNAAFKISAEDLDNMPIEFLALTQKENEAEDFSFIKKVNDTYFVNEKVISKSDFLKIFKNIVLIAEKSAYFEETTTNKYQHWLIGLVMVLLAVPVFLNGFLQFSVVFFILSVLGIYLSYETFNQSLGINKGLSSKFCSATPQTSCESVVKSNKWKIFETFSLSDVSLVFFVSQLILIILFSLNGSFEKLIDWSAYFLWIALPLVLLSIYYQKFVEIKWCPLCLGISAVLLIQTLLVYVLNSLHFSSIDLSVLFAVSTVLFLTSVAWHFIKNILTKSNDYKNQLSKAIRFKRNYNLFKEQLLKTQPLQFPKNDYAIYYGNKEANCQITILTSPFCGHCKKVHEILHDLHQKYSHKLAFHICYSIGVEGDSPAIAAIKNLQQLFLNDGLDKYEQALKSFYNKDNYINNFVEQSKHFQNNKSVNELLKAQNEFANQQHLNFTPMIFINGYKFPDIYEREDLVYFINDLIEDSF
jgi:uncharacterized membrane protein